ncbi:class II fructose-bisphosphate aldolase [Olsenella massiliensis]|uniref:class II fructose-bisphosphate aldolase n=1 Tax=Olsenella massiliensis TaxID=1622075 RepID=UPI00071C49A2|nr:class II fructose-bisphosphate aldolase [Olsenella massiliensis]
MLVNLRDICSIAEQNNMAIAAINVASFESVRAALDVAEQTGHPIIIQHAQGHQHLAPLKDIGPTMIALAERSSALVCVHLDHCEDLSYAVRALDMGFTGVMFDGSALPYETNVERSCRMASLCRDYQAGLECEIGSMGSREAGEKDEGGTVEESGAVYTNPDQAAEFVKVTGLDILACSFGTVHGIYKGEPHLNFDVLSDIRALAKVPLVMHGGSGVSDEDYARAIDAGIRKINYYTYGAKYAGEAVCALADRRRSAKPGAVVYWHDMTRTAYDTLRDTFEHVVTVFANGALPMA